MPTYAAAVQVTQLVADCHLDPRDRHHGPGAGRVEVYEIEAPSAADARKEALERFHRAFAIACPEDFELDAVAARVPGSGEEAA